MNSDQQPTADHLVITRKQAASVVLAFLSTQSRRQSSKIEVFLDDGWTRSDLEYYIEIDGKMFIRMSRGVICLDGKEITDIFYQTSIECKKYLIVEVKGEFVRFEEVVPDV